MDMPEQLYMQSLPVSLLAQLFVGPRNYSRQAPVEVKINIQNWEHSYFTLFSLQRIPVLQYKKDNNIK